MNFKDATNTLLTTVSLDSLCEKLGIETKGSGNSIKAICQFHPDTKPSMELYDNNPDGVSKYHCFSCGAHGDIFALVKENKGITFSEAHKWLANEYNVTVTRSSSRSKNKAITVYDKITKNAYEYALEFFKSTQNESQFNRYLSEREYDLDFVKKADLCIAGQHSLVTHLNSLEYPVDTHKLSVFDLYESAGLIKRSKIINEVNKTKNLLLDNLYYDHFRNNRLLFPIRTSEGVLKGFAGRLTDIDLGPKYLFTKNLNKSSLLYRSEFAFKNIRQDKEKLVKLYVCEGLFDAIRLERWGLPAVSILGANLSENQCKSIYDLALQLSRTGKLLEVNLFFDNDSAGVRATASAIKKLYKISNPGDFEMRVIHSIDSKKVDPDLYLKGVLTCKEAEEKIDKIEYPLPALFLANQLSISTEEVQNNDYYKDLPYSLKIRASKEWNKLFAHTQAEFSLDNYAKEYDQSEWFKFLQSASHIHSTPNVYSDESFIYQQSQRLQLAFSIAKSSMARTGTFPANDAEWRRVEMCFSALEMILIDRFYVFKGDLKPIEPLNTIRVSRDIGGEEFREMSQHCLEDLTSHQYILSELLTERHDNIDNFSLNIPATRYYSKSKITITTGEGGNIPYETTLSFAYQIDMEIVEGRDVPQTSGMFRPYFDCWKEFTKSINNAASKMPQVNMVRLDLKRYYDRLKRHVVQNALRDCLPANFDEVTDDSFMTLFKVKAEDKKVEIINWLLEQSFGYEKYDPKTGKVQQSDYFQGIPQGPDLSSFLANLVLFKVDHVAREFLEKHNDSAGYCPVWYARYVDDMVLLAEDTTLLAQLRVVVEDAVNNLELELIAKEQPMPMSAEEFELYLTQGKALASSGPDGNIELVEIEDIEFIEKIERYEALGLLNNKQLYTDDIATIKLKINLAAHGKQLRFSDIKKLTKWIWFAVIIESKSTNIEISTLIVDYKNLWDEVTSHLNQKLNPIECPWEDPLLLALDGLDQVIERNSWTDANLDENQLRIKLDVRVKIINLIKDHNLIGILSDQGLINSGGWGSSKIELTRTYWQKRTNLLWHARQYNFTTSSSEKIERSISDMNSQLNNDDLKLSLIRTHITELICEQNTNIQKLEMPREYILRSLCILLQSIYLKFSTLPSDISIKHDVLKQISGEIEALALVENDLSESIKLFNLFLDDSHTKAMQDPDNNLAIRALHFICNLTSDSQLIDVLSKRWNGLINASIGSCDYKLITPLPTIDENTIYGCSVDREQSSDISGLIRLSTDGEIGYSDIFVSSDLSSTRTDWKEKSPENQGQVLIQTANASSLNSAKNILSSPPNMLEIIDTNILKWTANTYRSILQCNEGGSRVPTWSNLAMKVLPSKVGDFVDNPVCIISPSNMNHSYPQAFIRNGGMGLRPLQIPNHNSQYWQAGTALTDILGFTRELDQYASVNEDADNVFETPQTRLLKNSLNKLNGSIYFSKPVFSNFTKQLPLTIERTLNLLEKFPEGNNKLDEYSYAFISEMETQLMRLRLDNKVSSTIGGGLFQLYGNAIKATLNRIPLEWFSHLNKVNTEDINAGGKTLRSSCHFWLSLYQVFLSTFSSTSINLEDKNVKRIKSIVLLGCQFNLIEAWLKAIVFESEALNSGTLNEYKNIDIIEQLSELPLEAELTIEVETLILRQKTEENSVKDLGEYYLSLLKDKATQNSFNEITPLGWYILALVKKNILISSGKNVSTPTEYLKELFDEPALLNLLSFKYETDENEVWPIEHTLPTINIETIISQLNILDYISSNDAFDYVSQNIITVAKNKRFSYEASKCNFQNDWFIRKWQVDIAASTANDNKPYYNNIENELVSSWTETHHDNKPIYISSCGNLYGQILIQVSDSSAEKVVIAPEEAGDSSAEEVVIAPEEAGDSSAEEVVIAPEEAGDSSAEEVVIAPEEAGDSSAEKVVIAPEEAGDSSAEEVVIAPEEAGDSSAEEVVIVPEEAGASSAEEVSTAPEEASDSSAEEVSTAPEEAGDSFAEEVVIDTTSEYSENNNKKFSNKPFDEKIWRKLEEIQKNMNTKAWSSRKVNKSPSHVRIALLQLELKGQFGQGYDLPTSKTQIADVDNYKYEEMRRQAVLTKAISSCEKLGVDLLILPEYSVQPDTIEWLKKQLIKKDISILAGTYRLPNGYSNEKLIELTNSNYAESVKPYQAIMSLLIPYNEGVICLNRAKKYASAAADELIYPHQYPINPLFTINNFEKEALRSIESLESKLENELDQLKKETIFSTEINKIRELISGIKPSFSIDDIEELFKIPHVRPLHYLQELICAELFLLTNPINYMNLASEFKNLCNKFGVLNSNNPQESFAEVQKDIETLSGNLSGINKDTGRGFQPYRRSIIAIPAMTSRKADYWIFGQSAMLANGCSTIFCNSVYGRHSTGGSCFIGLDSWLEKDEQTFITPYSGWSKGIYYGNKKDTLDKEQALLVVDIDPLMMSLGKPRPQSLPVPMKLVAHVPIIEIPKMGTEDFQLIKDDKYSKNILLATAYKGTLEAFEKLEAVLKPNEIINPENKKTQEAIKKFIHMIEQHKHITESCKDRIRHWKENWEKNPQVGIPTLTDWISVQIPTKEMWELDNEIDKNA